MVESDMYIFAESSVTITTVLLLLTCTNNKTISFLTGASRKRNLMIPNNKIIIVFLTDWTMRGVLLGFLEWPSILNICLQPKIINRIQEEKTLDVQEIYIIKPNILYIVGGIGFSHK